MAESTLVGSRVPEQGQMAEVRRRLYVVSEVRRSVLPPTKANIPSQPRHLVSLVSLEDDALGEELQVIWEIEPGARVFEKMALPEPAGFDDPARLDAFLDAVRWGAASVADTKLVQSPFRSGIEIDSYQLDPVVRAVRMPRVSLLIADDVGLGKTIETGLVMLELMLRHRAQRMLVVCPASLQIKWRDEMLEKFGLEFRIVDGALMKRLRRERGLNANPWTHFPRLITSMDYLKRERPMRLFREVVPAGASAYPRRFDILVVDEAHNAAPSGRGQIAHDSDRTIALRDIARHFEHKIFLTATPHNGYQESFSALLELLDDQRFHRGVAPDRQQLQTVMVRRLKSEIRDSFQEERFARRLPLSIEVDYTPEETEIHRALQRYTESRLERVAASPGGRMATEFVLKLLKKRLFSSPPAFLSTLDKHIATMQGNGAGRGAAPSVRHMMLEFDRVETEFDDEQEQEETTTEALDTAARALSPLTAEEAELLKLMRRWAERAAARLDSKAQRLLAWIDENLRSNGGWTDARLIIFTEYRDTQKWLYETLAHRGLAAGGRVELLHGGLISDERERVKAAFQFDPQGSPVRILLATDAASEGIDLQRHCHQLIHYEVPWNPNRMEQRNGRVDRRGQRAKEVRVFHFVARGYEQSAGLAAGKGQTLAADLEFLYRAAVKINQIREDLGKVGPVIAQQVEEAMLGRRRELDTSKAEKDAEPVRRLLKFEQNVREQIQKLAAQIDETRRELRLAPSNIEAVVHIALSLARQPGLIPAKLADGKPAFHVPAYSDPSWAPCLEGLHHPHTKEQRPIVFNPDLAVGRDDVVLAHLNHRLVQRCLRLLRAEVWAPEDQRKIYRVTARRLRAGASKYIAVLAHARLVLVSNDSQRLHEEVFAAGVRVLEERMDALNVSESAELLAAQEAAPVSGGVQAKLQALWPKVQRPLQTALQARMRDRAKSIARELAERAVKEEENIRAVLGELQKTIRKELDDPEIAQLELFSPIDREQIERTRDSLRARLEEIPAELEREVEQIRRRFAEPEPRLFPVAVTFLAPEGLA